MQRTMERAERSRATRERSVSDGRAIGGRPGRRVPLGRTACLVPTACQTIASRDVRIERTLRLAISMPTEDEKTRVDAVVDTNVLLDIHSCHDAMDSYNKAHALLAAAAIDDPSVVFRRARARESLLLAIYFDKIDAVTHSLHNEAVDRLVDRSPPAPGGTSIASDFTMTFVHFVKDHVLPGWDSKIVSPHRVGRMA